MLIDKVKATLEGATPGPWLRSGGTVYALREVFTRRGAEAENAWQAQFLQDGRYKTPLVEVEANAELSRLSPDMACRLIAAEALEDALRWIVETPYAHPSNMVKIAEAALAAYRKAGEANAD